MQRGRPKKYRTAKRVLLFLDMEVLSAFDQIHKNRSSAVNRILKSYVAENKSNE